MITHRLWLSSPKLCSSLRIALASDLHSKDPSEALEHLAAARPHAIAVAGDLFDSPRDDPKNALRFLEECGKMAKVFYTAGNHERNREFLKALDLRRLGVSHLENQTERWGELLIGGYSDGDSRPYAAGFARLCGFKILLCHRPEYFQRYLRDLDIDLVLSGHAHGGQIRLFGRGLYAPGQGLFPRYTSGLYHGRHVVSAGLSNSVWAPRWGNPTELVLIELAPKMKGKTGEDSAP